MVVQRGFGDPERFATADMVTVQSVTLDDGKRTVSQPARVRAIELPARECRPNGGGWGGSGHEWVGPGATGA